MHNETVLSKFQVPSYEDAAACGGFCIKLLNTELTGKQKELLAGTLLHFLVFKVYRIYFEACSLGKY